MPQDKLLNSVVNLSAIGRVACLSYEDSINNEQFELRERFYERKLIYDSIRLIQNAKTSIDSSLIPIEITLRRMELALNGVDSIRKKMINRRNIWNLPESNLIENQYQIYNKQLSYYSLLLYISIFIFSLGIVLWSKYDSIDRRIILRQNFDKPLVYERCQSCAKIFDSEVKYGTKSDQSLNFVYCFECYQKGKFTEPKLTMQEQLTLIVPPIDKKYNPLYRIYFGLINYIKLVYFQIKLGELDRWKTNRYFKNFKADIFLFLALLNIILLITIILFKIIF